MGDAEVGVVSLDPADAGGLAASRALQMEGGSLPPRKRLLAGLKLNGLLSTSPPPVASPTVESGVPKCEDGCMGCNAVESSGLRRIKRGGVSLRLCSACTLLYSKNMFCPHCLVMYHDTALLRDPSMWLVCTRCRRSVHPECEQKHSGSKPDAASYVCLDCVNSARRQREVNGVTGMRSKHSSGRPVPNFHGETGSGASPIDFVNPALKKPRLHRDRSGRPGDHERSGDGSRFERHRPSPDAPGGTKTASLGPPRKMVSSQAPPSGDRVSPQEAAATAKNAAIAAAKVAAAAKANAAVKAGAAVKAAAAAKAALEAAALACKAAAACRAELRRKPGNSETRLAAGGGAMRLEINVHSEPRRERSSKGETKYEGDEGYPSRRAGAGSVDDEELARQLHRVINSSPRISRSMTPVRRKNPSVKPETPSSGVSNSSAETVRALPRTYSSPADPEAPHEQPEQQQHHQFRHQQTRPRSITHKECRRLDSRVSRQEGKPANEGNGQSVGGQEPTSHPEPALRSVGEGQPAEEPAVKSEVTDGVMFSPVGVHDETSVLFDALVEVDGGAMQAAGGCQASHDRRPDYLQEILEAAVLSDAGMFTEGTTHVVSNLDTVRPEPETPEQRLEPLETAALQSEAVTTDADEASGDAVAGDATKETAEDVTVAVSGVAGDAVVTEARDAMATEAADPMSVDASVSMAREAAVTMAVEVADTMPEEAAVTMVAEVVVTVAADAVSSGQDEGTGSAVVHDVEMREVGSGDATQMGEEDGIMLEPLRTSGARVEESSGGEAAVEEMRIEEDAMTPITVGAGVPSEDTKSDASVNEVHAASRVTESAAQQSG